MGCEGVSVQCLSCSWGSPLDWVLMDAGTEVPQGVSHGEGKEPAAQLKFLAVPCESWASGNSRQGCPEELGFLSIGFLSGIPIVTFVL